MFYLFMSFFSKEYLFIEYKDYYLWQSFLLSTCEINQKMNTANITLKLVKKYQSNPPNLELPPPPPKRTLGSYLVLLYMFQFHWCINVLTYIRSL